MLQTASTIWQISTRALVGMERLSHFIFSQLIFGKRFWVSVILSLNNLAALYHQMGLYEKAEPPYCQAASAMWLIFAVAWVCMTKMSHFIIRQ
jgi:hypothetical protein